MDQIDRAAEIISSMISLSFREFRRTDDIRDHIRRILAQPLDQESRDVYQILDVDSWMDIPVERFGREWPAMLLVDNDVLLAFLPGYLLAALTESMSYENLASFVGRIAPCVAKDSNVSVGIDVGALGRDQLLSLVEFLHWSRAIFETKKNLPANRSRD